MTTTVQFGVLLQHLQVLLLFTQFCPVTHTFFVRQTPLHADMYVHVVCVCVHACTVIWYSKEGYEHKMKVGRQLKMEAADSER
jgi:hypothetical protein